MKVTEVKIGQVWKNYKSKAEKSVAGVTEDEAMMDDMSYIPIKTLLAGKSWKCVSENAVEHEEETAGDNTPEVVEEIVQDEKSLADHYINDKKKAKKSEKKADKKPKKVVQLKKEKQPKVSTEEKMLKVKELAEIIQKSGSTAKVFEKKCMVSCVTEKRSMAEFYVRAGKIAIWCKDVVANNFADKYSVSNHPTCGMKWQFDVPGMLEAEEVIKFINSKEEK